MTTTRRSILHMLTPMAQMSPFDVNMAVDAGFDVVVPYTHVESSQVTNLVQDAIFSRGPGGVKRTAIFIGGRDLGQADDMLNDARKAMVPPFEVSVFADPSGAYTTAAAMVACVEKALRDMGQALDKQDVVVLGVGPVGAAAGVLCAAAGARARLVSHSSLERAKSVTDELARRFDAKVEPASSQQGGVAALLADATVILACAKAGVRVVDKAALQQASRLRVAADVNAVPPAGVEGVDAMDSAKPLAGAGAGAVGIGALAIGNVKYKTEQGMFAAMLEAPKPIYQDFRQAMAIARVHAG